MQELDGLRVRPPGLEQHDAADPLVTGRDRHLGDDPGRHGRHAAAALLADVAPDRGQGGLAAGRGGGHAEPRHDDRHRAAGGLGRQQRDGRQPVARQHGVEHLQMDRTQALDERGGDGGRSELGLCHVGLGVASGAALRGRPVQARL